ncbi:MAG: helix-turn-helix transcriptional regulator, partial [Saprospiraceae bacterium]|nr:helix-turn-helix transcriptional regulator [Saprospiraceae bacterium]
QYFSPSEHSRKELLTPRQQQIVSGLVEGLSYKMIADKYLISIETVRDHIKKIYKKLQINSKAELIRLSIDGEI